MGYDTGLEEVALENLQASKSALRKDDELPTREKVLDMLRDCYKYVDADHGVCFSPTMAVNELITRGWLKVRQS